MDEVVQMQTAFDRYLELKSEVEESIGTYIFIDYHGHLCCKARTLPRALTLLKGQSSDIENYSLSNLL